MSDISPKNPDGTDVVRLILKPEVLDRTGVTYPTIWQWMREGKFPRSRELGGKSAWVESEVTSWILSRPIRRLKGDTEIHPAPAAT
jgi:prophage regulatory protein